MSIRKIIGEALRKPIMSIANRENTRRIEIDGRIYMIADIRKDEFSRLRQYMQIEDGILHYAVRLSSKLILTVPSLWTVEQMNAEFRHANGIMMIACESQKVRSYNTIFSYDEMPTEDEIRALTVRMHQKEHKTSKRDSQRSKHYLFETTKVYPLIDKYCKENAEPSVFRADSAEIKKLISKIVNDYGLTNRVMFEVIGTRNSESLGIENFLGKDVLGSSFTLFNDLLSRHINMWIVMVRPVTSAKIVSLHTLLHEMAHVIVADDLGKTDGHGSQFTAVFVELLNRYVGIPISELVDLYRENKVSIDAASIYDHENACWNTYGAKSVKIDAKTILKGIRHSKPVH